MACASPIYESAWQSHHLSDVLAARATSRYANVCGGTCGAIRATCLQHYDLLSHMATEHWGELTMLGKVNSTLKGRCHHVVHRSMCIRMRAQHERDSSLLFLSYCACFLMHIGRCTTWVHVPLRGKPPLFTVSSLLAMSISNQYMRCTC